MQNKIQQTVIAGIAATAVMTVVMFIGGTVGMPKMRPPDMLSAMMGIPVFVGWLLHFMVGTIFSAGYVFFLNSWLKKIHSKVLKGAIFGIAVFIIAQIAIPILESIFGKGSMPQPEGSMTLLVTGSIIEHVIYGITVAFMAKPETMPVKQAVR